MLPLVAVSGPECIDVLLEAGFSLRSRGGGVAVLARDLRVVTVPDTVMLTATELVGILRDAGVPYSVFLDHLSEAPTDPDLRVVTGVRQKYAMRRAR